MEPLWEPLLLSDWISKLPLKTCCPSFLPSFSLKNPVSIYLSGVALTILIDGVCFSFGIWTSKIVLFGELLFNKLLLEKSFSLLQSRFLWKCGSGVFGCCVIFCFDVMEFCSRSSSASMIMSSDFYFYFKSVLFFTSDIDWASFISSSIRS